MTQYRKRRPPRKQNTPIVFAAVAITILMALVAPQENENRAQSTESAWDAQVEQSFDAQLESPYTTINDNLPYFTTDELAAATKSYESYAELDALGRCGVCIASVGVDLMPTEERGEIGDIKPSGWNQAKYSDLIEGNYLYNRCHLIGYQLSGENANVQNLITGTRYLNTEGMLPFENEVAEYVKTTGNHVLYRVTPIFDGDNLVASGVLMEAESVEDEGSGVRFCVYCYNVQPGITIDYSDGSSEKMNG